jgi:hypothetical protein
MAVVRIRPSVHVLFFLLEAALIGAHFAFAEWVPAVGKGLFWAAVVGLVLWAAAWLGCFDQIDVIARFLRPKAERDISVAQVVAYVCFRQWGREFLDAAGAPGIDAPTALAEVRQAAADGIICIWGKRPGQQVYEKVPTDFWVRHQIEWFGLLRNRTTTEPTISVADRGDRYEDLMASKIQVQDKWLRKRKKLRLQVPWRVTNA